MRQSAMGPMMLGGVAAVTGAAAGFATGGIALSAVAYVICGAAGVLGGGVLLMRAAEADAQRNDAGV